MRRRVFVALGAIAVGLLVTVAPTRRSARHPNVLLITVDTLRADHVGAYGARGVATPTLDRLAARGVLFRNAFSAVPITLASHATILTGRYPPNHGVRGNSFYHLPDHTPTLATMLKPLGYSTAAVVGAAVLDHRFGLDQGFDVYDDQTGHGGRTLIAERDASAVVSRAVAWLEQRERRSPFFLWVHLFDPHHPYEPPEPFRSRFARSPYDGEIAYADQQIGRLLDALAAAGGLDDTLVVATSDHGESLGEHGEATHGVLLYDSTLRVPLIIAGPGVHRGGRASLNAVDLVDVVPTVLARARAPERQGLDGRDMLAGNPASRSLYAETYLPLDFYNWSPMRALRADGLKFIEAPEPELYDLSRDPAETRNLVDAQAARARGMAAELSRMGARSSSASGTRPAIDADLADRLRSLGYVAGTGAAADSRPTDVIRPNPKSQLPLVAVLDRALAFMRAGRREEAVATLRAVLADDPGNYLAARTVGDVLFDLGRDQESIEAYRRALANGRDAAYYHYRIALLYERKGSYSNAAGELAHLVEMSPDAVSEVAERGKQLLARGAAAGAIAYFQVAARADTGVGLAVHLADALLGNRLPAAAVEMLERALQEHPGDEGVRGTLVRALNALGVARGEASDLTGAVHAFARAQVLAPSDFESLANGGMAQLRAGQTAAALETLTRAIALRPTEVRVLNPAAELRFRRGDLREARDLLKRSLAVDPRQPRIEAALRQVERRLAGS